MKIAIIADSHGIYRKEWEKKWQECEYCIHLGDFLTQENYDSFENYFGTDHFVAVKGNMDKELTTNLPKTRKIVISNLKICLIHNKAFLSDEDMQDVDLILAGHSHHYEELTVLGLHFLNPGTIGEDRGNGKSFVILDVDENGNYDISKIVT